MYREKDGLIYVKISNNLVCVCAHVGEKETENTNKDIIDTHNKNTEE